MAETIVTWELTQAQSNQLIDLALKEIKRLNDRIEYNTRWNDQQMKQMAALQRENLELKEALAKAERQVQ